METKVCSSCRNEKPTSEYHKDGAQKDGLRSSCKLCTNDRNRRWYESNADQVKSICRRYYERNADRIKRASKQWRAENPEYAAEYFKTWRNDNMETIRANHRARRARKRGAGGHHTTEDVQRIIRHQRGRCACCRSKLVAYHVDHIIPLKLKGSNNPDNIQILCPTCNLQKNAKHPIDFMQERGFLL